MTHETSSRWLGLVWASVSFGLVACGSDPPVTPPADVPRVDAADVITPTDTGVDSGRDVLQPPIDATDVPVPPPDMVIPPVDVPVDAAVSARPDNTVRTATGGFMRPLDAVPTASGATVFFIAFNGMTGEPTVYRQGLGGMVSQVNTGEPLSSPTSLAISADDSRIYVADPTATSMGMGAIENDGAILSMGAEPGMVTVLGIGTSVHHPRAIAVHGSPEQLTFVATADNGEAGIYRVSSGGGTPTRLDMGAMLRDPSGIAVADDGTVYVLDGQGTGPTSGSIWRIAAAGGAPTAVGSGGLSMSFPAGIGISRDGTRLLAAGRDSGNGPSLLTWIRTDGTMAESPATLGVGLAIPCGLHRARNVDVYAIADDSANDTGAIFTAR